MAVQEFTTEELANEIWKPAFEWEVYYEASNLGRIRNRKTKHVRKLRKLRRVNNVEDLYDYTVHLNASGRDSTLSVARIIAGTFLGPRADPDLQINHKDANPLNNRIENLEYITRLENIHHAKALGLLRIGKDRYNAKLTDADIPIIRELFWDHGLSKISIAEIFKVGQTVIHNIAHRRKWSHIP